MWVCLKQEILNQGFWFKNPYVSDVRCKQNPDDLAFTYSVYICDTSLEAFF